MLGISRTFSAALAVVALALGAFAQTPAVARVTPEVASPGDLVIITGTNLGAVTQVRFTAFVGGFVNQLTMNVTPISVSANRVTALVPTFNAFTPPGAFPPSNPIGTVRAVAGATLSNGLSFYFLESTFGQTTTVGNGTTLSTGQGRPVVSFAIAGGAPTPGNSTFLLRLENAPASTFAYLAVAAPAPTPYSLIGDGTIVVTSPFVLLVSNLVTTPQGDVDFFAPIPGPGPFGITVMVQFAVIDFGAGGLALSNGMQIQL